MAWVLVLTAAPGRGLTPRDLDAARRAAGAEGGALRVLGPQGAEIPFAARPALPDLPGIDANAIPAEGRRKRVLIADMDSTMIPVECIDEVAAAAGIKDRVAAITERAMAGALDFEAALAERVQLLAGLPMQALDDVLARRIALNPGARVLVRTMAASGSHTALVSGGFTHFTRAVAAMAGFAEHRANELEIAGGRLTGRVLPPVLGREAKRSALFQITEGLGLTPADVIGVGDGANDLALIETAGLGVGFRPKPALAAAADAVIRHADLTALLHLQGWHAEEFVRD